MGLYRRSKSLYDTFRKFSTHFQPRNDAHPFTPALNLRCSGVPNGCKPAFFDFPSISSRFGFVSNGLKKGSSIGSNSGLILRRNYYVDTNQVRHFRPRGYQRWIQNPRVLLAVVVVGIGGVVTIYYGNLETVPYTKRKHLVLLSKSIERQIGESEFQKIKASFKGKILPAIHPDSIRVRLIAKDIVEALQRGLSNEHLWSDPGYASDGHGMVHDGHRNETLMALKGEVEGGEGWRKQDEVLDDQWVGESKKYGQQATTQHLQGLKWEVLVVQEPVVNAFCLPGGKIVVFTGLLEHFKTDPEIATIIGHEVGHAVARHSAEKITQNMWFTIVQLVLYQFIMPDLANAMSTLLLRLPFSRKMEIEADYIGLLLIASAGYDPRIAPKVYEKLGKITGESALKGYLSTHPSGNKRAQLLAQAQVMEEAMNLYREASAGHGIEGFL
ncbi:hypothetical protein Dimus_000381 [Dionaea muscipula]